jgi:parallel beta-helix repeat protein
LIDSVPVFGHFAGSETSRNQRDLNDPNNETILSGMGTSAPFVVSASGNSPDNIIDGFTIFRTSGNGLKIENAFLRISNCIITGAFVAGYGIYDTNSAFSITDCAIQNNSYGLYATFGNNGNLSESRISDSVIYNNSTGIYLYAASSPVLIENSYIINNNGDGIVVAFSSMPPVVRGCRIFTNSGRGFYISHSPVSIIDNLICRNSQRGIYLYYTTSPTIVRNNTIACNNQYGIYKYAGTTPAISNNIIWSNPVSDLYGCSATYSWLTANGDPCFVDADINDFHILPFSGCVNAGDPDFNDLSEVDIDGQCRVMIGQTAPRVDIGADEIEWPKPDFDRDVVISFNDYAILASAWQTIDPNMSLDTDDDVDMDDLAEFADYWLWAPSWGE